MNCRDVFSSYHPIVEFLYFSLTIGFTMFLMHPICLAISLICSALYCVRLRGAPGALFILRIALPMLALAAFVNPAFNHRGETILTYLPTGNPLTLESIIYGAAAGAMIAAALMWFACFSEVVTSDKFIYLFGKIIPALSLILSMSLRFVPQFKARMDEIAAVQAGMGRDIRYGGPIHRIKCAVICFSAAVTWSLESAVVTADSMKGRGYGLPGRTSFSVYKFTTADKYAVIWLSGGGFFTLCSYIAGGLSWRYFPNIRGVLFDPFSSFTYLVYAAICLTPLILDFGKDTKWKN